MMKIINNDNDDNRLTSEFMRAITSYGKKTQEIKGMNILLRSSCLQENLRLVTSVT